MEKVKSGFDTIVTTVKDTVDYVGSTRIGDEVRSAADSVGEVLSSVSKKMKKTAYKGWELTKKGAKKLHSKAKKSAERFREAVEQEADKLSRIRLENVREKWRSAAHSAERNAERIR